MKVGERLRLKRLENLRATGRLPKGSKSDAAVGSRLAERRRQNLSAVRKSVSRKGGGGGGAVHVQAYTRSAPK